MQGIRVICNEKNWDISPFLKTYQHIIQDNYVNEWRWRKPIRNPKRDLSVQVLCRHNIAHMEFYLEIKIRDILLGEKFIVSTEPDEFVFVNYLGQLKWKTLNSVLLISKDGHQVFEINLDDVSNIETRNNNLS
jgi:hypothetical protein